MLDNYDERKDGYFLWVKSLNDSLKKTLLRQLIRYRVCGLLDFKVFDINKEKRNRGYFITLTWIGLYLLRRWKNERKFKKRTTSIKRRN